MIGKGNFSEDFKRVAVAPITERAYPSSNDLGRLIDFWFGRIRSRSVPDRCRNYYTHAPKID